MTTRKSKTVKYLEKLNKGPLTFGEMLLSIRQTDEISQAELARLAGVSRGIICDIEKGRRLAPLELAAKLADVLGYPEKGFVGIALEDLMRKADLDYKVKLEEVA